MESTQPIEKAVAIPTFVGSLSSFVATSTAILLHVVFPPKRHFRHALVINLLVADCLNSLNNSISGGIFLRRGFTGNPATTASPFCIANAFIGQLTIQTIDFIILFISISVLCTVLDLRTFTSPSLARLLLVCAGAWVPGLITSITPTLVLQWNFELSSIGNVGLGLDAYGHVSGNWCWISPQYFGLRYALTHGWRIAIFTATIGIYTFIYLRLKRVFIRTRMSNKMSLTNTTEDHQSIGTISNDANARQVSAETSTRFQNLRGQLQHIPISMPSRPTKTRLTLDHTDSINEGRPSTVGLARTQQTFPSGPSGRISTSTATYSYSAGTTAPPNLKKKLWLNGYPIAYIILWIPGIVNRFVESKDVSPLWLRVLQCSTQYIGLANALTYGLNEQLRRRARERWNRQGLSGGPN